MPPVPIQRDELLAARYRRDGLAIDKYGVRIRGVALRNLVRIVHVRAEATRNPPLERDRDPLHRSEIPVDIFSEFCDAELLMKLKPEEIANVFVIAGNRDAEIRRKFLLEAQFINCRSLGFQVGIAQRVADEFREDSLVGNPEVGIFIKKFEGRNLKKMPVRNVDGAFVADGIRKPDARTEL